MQPNMANDRCVKPEQTFYEKSFVIRIVNSSIFGGKKFLNGHVPFTMMMTVMVMIVVHCFIYLSSLIVFAFSSFFLALDIVLFEL